MKSEEHPHIIHRGNRNTCIRGEDGEGSGGGGKKRDEETDGKARGQAGRQAGTVRKMGPYFEATD